jgi:hypothetical protein
MEIVADAVFSVFGSALFSLLSPQEKENKITGNTINKASFRMMVSFNEKLYHGKYKFYR